MTIGAPPTTAPPSIRATLRHTEFRRRARQPVGRNCKRPETRQPKRFRRPGDQGRGDRLRHSFSEPRFGG